MAPVAASPTPIVVPLPAVPTSTAPKDKKAAARKRFESVYTVVRDDLLDDFRKHNMPEEVIDYYRRVRTSTASFPLLRCSEASHRVWTTTSQVANLTEG